MIGSGKFVGRNFEHDMSLVRQLGAGYYALEAAGITIKKSVKDAVDMAFKNAGSDLNEIGKINRADAPTRAATPADDDTDKP